MKFLKNFKVLVLGVGVILAVASVSLEARHRWGGRRHHWGHHRWGGWGWGGPRFGIGFGYPYYYDYPYDYRYGRYWW